MASERQREFGEFLRGKREEQSVELRAIAAQTRIPMRSLRHLEDGAFDKLPADIFIRGFLRSYADCVGLDRSDVLDRYRELGIKPPSFSGDIVAAVRQSRARRSDATPLPAAVTRPDSHDNGDSAEPKRKRARTLLPKLSPVDEEREGRRGSVTVAVIILLIVATLTMSYLLRKPSSDSDGFTEINSPDAIADVLS